MASAELAVLEPETPVAVCESCHAVARLVVVTYPDDTFEVCHACTPEASA